LAESVRYRYSDFVWVCGVCGGAVEKAVQICPVCRFNSAAKPQDTNTMRLSIK